MYYEFWSCILQVWNIGIIYLHPAIGKVYAPKNDLTPLLALD